MRDYAERIEKKDALQAHPEYLNEQINDHDKAIYAKGWNDCNKEFYNAISELPVASIDCTDLSMRLRRAFEADELTNHRLLLEAADAIEELVAAVPPLLWTDEQIKGSEFMTHVQGGRGFEIHFRTDNAEKYKAVQEECRRQIDHAKPDPPKEVE